MTTRNYYQQPRDQIEKERTRQRESKRRSRAANPDQNRETQRQYRERHLEQDNARMRAYGQRQRAADRAAVFSYYGTACTCCGGADRLTIDHIDGDGRQHREELFGRNRGVSDKFYRWLVMNGFPAGYQVLCLRCNRSKGEGHACQLDHDVSPPLAATVPGDPDPLFTAAEAAFPGVAAGAPVPSIRSVRLTLCVGDARARRAREHLAAIRPKAA